MTQEWSKECQAVKVIGTFFDLQYVEATALDGSSLIQNVVSQGCDGESVISGHCAGVQQKICEVVLHAAYVHCYAHCLK